MSHQTIRAGDVGPSVGKLQRLLNDALDGVSLRVDGHFGPLTLQAVEAHQMRSIGPNGRPLQVDGVVGPLTWWSLEERDQSDAFRRYENEPPTSAVWDDETIRGRALEYALEEMSAGAREIGDNNAGKFVEKYHRRKLRAPWCAAGTSWCYWQAAQELGVEMPFEYTGGARHIQKQLHGKGWTYGVGESIPEPGDLVFWWRESPSSWKGHVGFVYAYGNGVLWTVEFNRGGYPAPVRFFDYVLDRERKLLGFARVPG